MKTALLTLFAALATTSAKADQCQIVTGQQAANAVSILQQESYVIKFCESCGDRMAVRVPVSHLSARVWGVQISARAVVLSLGQLDVALFSANLESQLELLLNGRGIDLAYVYDSKGRNLGHQSGCSNTSRYILPDVPVYGPRF